MNRKHLAAAIALVVLGATGAAYLFGRRAPSGSSSRVGSRPT